METVQDDLNTYMLFLDLISKAQEYKLAVRHFYFAKEELLKRKRGQDEIDSLQFPEKLLLLSNRDSIRLTTLEAVPLARFCRTYMCYWTLATRCRDCVNEVQFRTHPLSHPHTTRSRTSHEEAERELVDTQATQGSKLRKRMHDDPMELGEDEVQQPVYCSLGFYRVLNIGNVALPMAVVAGAELGNHKPKNRRGCRR